MKSNDHIVPISRSCHSYLPHFPFPFTHSHMSFSSNLKKRWPEDMGTPYWIKCLLAACVVWCLALPLHLPRWSRSRNTPLAGHIVPCCALREGLRVRLGLIGGVLYLTLTGCNSLPLTGILGLTGTSSSGVLWLRILLCGVCREPTTACFGCIPVRFWVIRGPVWPGPSWTVVSSPLLYLVVDQIDCLTYLHHVGAADCHLSLRWISAFYIVLLNLDAALSRPFHFNDECALRADDMSQTSLIRRDLRSGRLLWGGWWTVEPHLTARGNEVFDAIFLEVYIPAHPPWWCWRRLLLPYP